jgi:hypothetical protein
VAERTLSVLIPVFALTLTRIQDPVSVENELYADDRALEIATEAFQMHD